MLTISLFVVALLSAMLPAVALNSLNLYVQAAKEGAAGQSGGYTYQISGGSNDVAEELRQQVQNGKAIGVKSTQGSVGLTSASGSSRNTIADITFLTGPSRYGTLIEGHQPSQKSEISLSRAAAEQIDAQLGDIVTVQCDDSALSNDYKLIGITVDAANTNTVYATAVSSKDNLQNIQMWLTDDDATVNQGEVAKESATNNVNIGYIKSTIRNAEETVRTRDLPGCQWYGIVLFLLLAVRTYRSNDGILPSRSVFRRCCGRSSGSLRILPHHQQMDSVPRIAYLHNTWSRNRHRSRICGIRS
ncbi:hypothetical protein [Bifidobacterium sp.]|uniref:hypothetical protein n=1 Tax=Bifidobacterium sp. TaxID=41200 RepID=UPI0025C63752|nr:hypothetical protein [Bifidobacterium sp.]